MMGPDGWAMTRCPSLGPIHSDLIAAPELVMRLCERTLDPQITSGILAALKTFQDMYTRTPPMAAISVAATSSNGSWTISVMKRTSGWMTSPLISLITVLPTMKEYIWVLVEYSARRG